MNTRLRLIGIPISLGLVLAVFILLISTSFTGITLAAPSDPAADVQIQLDDGQAGCCDINGVNSESSETEDSDSSLHSHDYQRLSGHGLGLADGRILFPPL